MVFCSSSVPLSVNKGFFSCAPLAISNCLMVALSTCRCHRHSFFPAASIPCLANAIVSCYSWRSYKDAAGNKRLKRKAKTVVSDECSRLFPFAVLQDMMICTAPVLWKLSWLPGAFEVLFWWDFRFGDSIDYYHITLCLVQLLFCFFSFFFCVLSRVMESFICISFSQCSSFSLYVS